MTLPPQSDPAVRRTGLGGSDIAKLLGLSRFGGPMDLWLEKTGHSAPLVETPVMRWGKLLEEPIAREYAAITGRKVRRVNGTLRHPQHEELFCHLDRTAHKKGEKPRVLEAKTAGQFQASDFGDPGSDQVPDDYMIQVQHYLGVTGYGIADLAVLIAGQKFAIYEIPRDDALIGEMHEEAVRFWRDNVVARNPPDIDGSEASSRYLAARFKPSGASIEADEETQLLAFRYRNAHEAIKEQEAAKALAGNQLRERLGDAVEALAGSIKITYKPVASSPSIDWPAIVAAAKVPATLVALHTTRAPASRRLTVTIKEGA